MSDVAQDRWGGETKLKSLRLTVGEHHLTLEGERLELDAATFKLIDIWVKAITPVGQEAIDKLTGTLKQNNDALAGVVAAHPVDKK